MKKDEVYQVPLLGIADIFVEQGFAASSSGIDNPDLVQEDGNFWS